MLLEFKVPASFLVERWGLPTAAEIGYGFRMGWIRRTDVVDLALEKYEAGVPISSTEQDLALLLSEDYDRVDEWAQVLEISDQPVERRARYWAFAILAWLWERRSEFRDPFRLIDLVYAEFEYPEEIAPLARFTVLGPTDAPGFEGIEQRWRECVSRWRIEYRDRNIEPVQPD
jgi:hypothetical protein